jgi:hypothetical protein
MDKLEAMEYILGNNPVCTDCARGNLEQVRIAAGLYQVLKDISSAGALTYTRDDLNRRIQEAMRF